MGLRARPGADDRAVRAEGAGGAVDQHRGDVDRRLRRRAHQRSGELDFVPDFSTLGQFDVTEVWNLGRIIAAALTIFAIMLTDFFDTMGTATAITEQAGLTTPDGRVPGINRVLLVDSVAAAAGGAAGISSNTSYIESAAGVAEGGRTGLTSVVTGVLFLLADVRDATGADGAVRGDRAGARRGRLSDGDPHQGHQLRRCRGGLPGAARDHAHAAHLQHHRWHRCGVRLVRAHQGRARQVGEIHCSCGSWRSPSRCTSPSRGSTRCCSARPQPDRWRPAGPPAGRYAFPA